MGQSTIPWPYLTHKFTVDTLLQLLFGQSQKVISRKPVCRIVDAYTVISRNTLQIPPEGRDERPLRRTRIAPYGQGGPL